MIRQPKLIIYMLKTFRSEICVHIRTNCARATGGKGPSWDIDLLLKIIDPTPPWWEGTRGEGGDLRIKEATQERRGRGRSWYFHMMSFVSVSLNF